MSTDHDPLLASVRALPDENTPRLVFADWCDEQDDPERAEFIRLQVAISQSAPDDPKLGELRTRERELLAAHAIAWCAPLGLEPDACEFRRGFIESVEISAGQFLEQAESLFRVAPLRHIHFLRATQHLPELANCPWLGRLTVLDLSGNAIRDDGVAVLATSPHLGKLTTLDLSGCEIHTEGAEHLAVATNLTGLRELRLAGCGIKADGFGALLRSPSLQQVTKLDVRGNHQCWVSPNADELWVTLTETNIDDDGVRLLAGNPEAARLETVELSLNLVGEDGWEALINSPKLGQMTLNVFESDYVFPNEATVNPTNPEPGDTANEELSDVLCLAIPPGGRRRPLPRQPIDPRWTAPPCTIDPVMIRRLRDRFGPRVTFTPPSVRYGALFSGTRDDWFGLRAVLEPFER
jgi:uncharacterized protein (TIGR02996 family)